RLRSRPQRGPLDPPPRPSPRVPTLPRQTPPAGVLQRRCPLGRPRPDPLPPATPLACLGRRVHRSPHPHPSAARLRLSRPARTHFPSRRQPNQPRPPASPRPKIPPSAIPVTAAITPHHRTRRSTLVEPHCNIRV